MAVHEVTIYAMFDDEEGDLDLLPSSIDLAFAEVSGLSHPVTLVKEGNHVEVPD